MTSLDPTQGIVLSLTEPTCGHLVHLFFSPRGKILAHALVHHPGVSIKAVAAANQCDCADAFNRGWRDNSLHAAQWVRKISHDAELLSDLNKIWDNEDSHMMTEGFKTFAKKIKKGSGAQRLENYLRNLFSGHPALKGAKSPVVILAKEDDEQWCMGVTYRQGRYFVPVGRWCQWRFQMGLVQGFIDFPIDRTNGGQIKCIRFRAGAGAEIVHGTREEYKAQYSAMREKEKNDELPLALQPQSTCMPGSCPSGRATRAHH